MLLDIKVGDRDLPYAPINVLKITSSLLKKDENVECQQNFTKCEEINKAFFRNWQTRSLGIKYIKFIIYL